MSPTVLFEDNHLLIVDKPAGLVTMGAPFGTPTLLDACRDYLREKYDKPGNVYLGVVSRLDAPVTGAVVIARTSKAAARMSEQFRQGEVEKLYWALVSEPPDPAAATCEDWVRKDERHRRMHVAGANHPEAKRAVLHYETLRQLRDGRTLLAVRLETGRKHQIRLQLSHRGRPILGDRKYGSRAAFSAGIALHSRRVSFVHPVRRTALEVEAPLPASWPRQLTSMGRDSR